LDYISAIFNPRKRKPSGVPLKVKLFFPTEDSAIAKIFPGKFQLEILTQWIPRLEQLTINLGGINLLLTSVIINKMEEY